jgi:Tfp pilus assembly protein FimV
MWYQIMTRRLAVTGIALFLLNLNACMLTSATAPTPAEPVKIAAPPPQAPAPTAPLPPREYNNEPTTPRIVMFDPLTGQVINPQQTPDGADFHTVTKGDTLFAIAKRYGCTVEQLMTWNQLRNANISIGQNLRVRPS